MLVARGRKRVGCSDLGRDTWTSPWVSGCLPCARGSAYFTYLYKFCAMRSGVEILQVAIAGYGVAGSRTIAVLEYFR